IRPENSVWDLLATPYTPAAPVATAYAAAGVGNYFCRRDWTTGSPYVFAVAGRFDEWHLGQSQGDFGLFCSGWFAVSQNTHSVSGIEETLARRNLVRFIDSRGALVPQTLSNLPPAVVSDDGVTWTWQAQLGSAYGNKGIVWSRTLTFNRLAGSLRVQDQLV